MANNTLFNKSNLAGVATLTKRLRELGKLEDGKALRRAVSAGMRPTLRAAKQLIPKSTRPIVTYKGRLVGPGFASRNVAIATTLSKDKQQATAMVGVRKEAFYAVAFVERGTSKMKAQPWLRPAFYSTRHQQEAALRDSLFKTLQKASKVT